MTKALPVYLAISAGLLCAQEFKVGAPVADFQVRDLDGKAVSFSSLKGPVTVVTFIATQCPVSNSYNQRMIDLYKDYAPRNVSSSS